jgi:hypothetical protein
MNDFSKQAPENSFAEFVIFLATVALFFLVAFFPVITCHGQGSGGNCGEGVMASLPIALLLLPLLFMISRYVVKQLWP